MEKNTETEKELEKQEEIKADEPQVPEDISPEAADSIDAIPETEDPTAKLKDDLTEAKDKYVRLYAEFENHRRRTSREKLELIQSANVDLICALLPIIDDFERAEKAANDQTSQDMEGFKLIYQKMKRLLDQYGVKSMTLDGNEFDPEIHEAVTQIEVTEEEQKGKIVEVLEQGYLLNDKVIRFAKVVVGK